MKTFNKYFSIKILFCFFTITSFSQSEDLSYHETSNILVSEKKSKALNIGVNYTLGYKEFQVIYSIDSRFLVFGMYNYNTLTEERTAFFGDKITQENNNNGYCLGIGIKNFGEIGDYETLEILGGYEFQKAAIASYFTNSKYVREKEFLDQKYFKYFVQFNMIQNGNRHFSGTSIKISYFKFQENQIYKNSTNLFFTPSYSYNYKLLSNRSLILTSQIGISIPIKSFETSNSSDNGSFISQQSDYVIGAILKFGVQYKFSLTKKKL